MSDNPLSQIMGGLVKAADPKPYVWAPVVCVDPRGPLRVRLLRDRVWGNYLHHDGRSFFCTGKGSCRGCAALLARRWAAWVCCCSWDYRQTWVVKLSAGATKQLELLSEVHGSLLGRKLLLRRRHSKSNAPQIVDVDADKEVDWDQLPPAFDFRGVVLSIHGVDDDTIRELLRSPDSQQWTSRTR